MASPQVNTGTSLSDVTSSIYKPAMDSANKFDKDTDEGIKKMESEKVPTPPTLSESPKPENYKSDPMEAFGSPVVWLSTFGSLLTKQPLETALNSGAAVFKARTQSGAQDFKQATEKWKNDTENAWKMANYQQDLYKDVLNKDEAELRSRAVSAKDNVMIHMADAKMQMQLQKDRDRNTAKLQKNLESQNYAAEKMKEAADAGKNPQEQREAYFTALGDVKAMESGKGNASGAVGVDWGNAKNTDPVPGTGLTVGAIKIYGDAIKDGVKPSQLGLGYGMNPVKKAVDNYVSEKYPDFKMAESELGYLGSQTEEKLTAKNEANVNVASNNLDNSLPLLMEQVKAVNPGQFKSWNEFKNYLDENTSDPKIVKLNQAVEDTLSDYGMLLARGGQVTDKVRGSADKILNSAWASGQFDGAVEVIERTSANQKKSAQESKKESEGGEADKQATGYSSASPLPKPKDNKYQKDKFYDLSGEGHGTHKYLGNGEFE